MNIKWNHVRVFYINSPGYAGTINGIIDRLNRSLETFFKMCQTVTVIFKQTAAWARGLEEPKHQ